MVWYTVQVYRFNCIDTLENTMLTQVDSILHTTKNVTVPTKNMGYEHIKICLCFFLFLNIFMLVC